MAEIAVGKLYVPGKTVWPEEVEYLFDAGMHQLRFFLRHPSVEEVEALRSGELEFALVVSDEIIVLLYKTATIGWSDAPFTVHRVPKDRQLPLPELVPGKGLALTITLVDAATGIVKVLRMVALPYDFAELLQRAIAAQMIMFHEPSEYERHVRALQASYSSERLLTLAIARCSITAKGS